MFRDGTLPPRAPAAGRGYLRGRPLLRRMLSPEAAWVLGLCQGLALGIPVGFLILRFLALVDALMSAHDRGH